MPSVTLEWIRMAWEVSKIPLVVEALEALEALEDLLEEVVDSRTDSKYTQKTCSTSSIRQGVAEEAAGVERVQM